MFAPGDLVRVAAVEGNGRKFEMLGIVEKWTPEGWSVRAKKLRCANPRVLAEPEQMTMVIAKYVQKHRAEIAKLPPSERKKHQGYWWVSESFDV